MIFFIALIYYNGETKFMKFSLFFMFSYISLPMALMARYIIEFTFEPFSMNLLLIILLLIWASDSFAYLIGSRIGKTKLMERISPNKTWEGYFGGGIMAIIAGIALSFTSAYSMKAMIIFALIAWIIGTYGDLFESSIKRKHNIKDSGDILPGHGGFLDRFDSFIFVIPFVLSIIYFYYY